MDKTTASEFKQRVQKIKGVSYVYEDHPYGDSEKRQARHKRVYLGKLDGEGIFVPSKAYQAGLSSSQAVDAVLAQARRRHYGASYLLSHVGQATGVEKDLRACFPDICQEVLSLVYFLVLEGESAVYRFSKWGTAHWHPCEMPLASQRISVLFGMFGEDRKMDFFRRQARRRVEKEYLAYDTTSISSYSQLIKQAKYGFNRILAALETELKNGSVPDEHKAAAERYFTVHETPVRGRRVKCNDDAVRNHTRNFGFFILMTNDAQSGQDVLCSYRNKDLVEKTFCNLKNRLYMKRTMVSSAENLEGKLFVEFLALIYLAYIHNVMKDNNPCRNYSIQSMLDELDSIERFEYPGRRPHCGEITKRQKELFDTFKVPHPEPLL